MIFSFFNWLSEYFLWIYLFTAAVTITYIYFIFKWKIALVFKFLISVSFIMLTMFIISSVGFIFTSGNYIQETRQYLYEQQIASKEQTDIFNIENVDITNNRGETIPKFSEFDERKYVSVYYTNGFTEYTQPVISVPIKNSDYMKEYALSYVEVKETIEPSITNWTNILLSLRDKVGFNDSKLLNIKPGVYHLKLHVPSTDFQEIEEEMDRKSR